MTEGVKCVVLAKYEQGQFSAPGLTPSHLIQTIYSQVEECGELWELLLFCVHVLFGMSLLLTSGFLGVVGWILNPMGPPTPWDGDKVTVSGASLDDPQSTVTK